jgi:hypothetical protein
LLAPASGAYSIVSAEDFHVAVGGPFHRVARAAHIEPFRRLVPILVGTTWAPLMVLGLARFIATHEIDPLLRDLSVHARLLVALPLFLVAERLLDRVGQITIARLFDEGFVPDSSKAKVRALLDRIEAWRDSTVPEIVLLLVALGAGLAVLVGWLAPAGALHGLKEGHFSPVLLWYGLVSLPVFQFSLWRALFRWGLWVRVLVGLARTPLRLLPAHADRRAGIGFVKNPTVVYCSVMLLATSTVLSASWATRIINNGETLEAFRSLFFAYVLIAILIAFGPLVLFVPHLVRARVFGIRKYGALVSDYSARFDKRWLGKTERDDLLGTPDIQSLADLGTSYHEGIEKLGVFLFGRQDWEVLAIATLLPAIPLFFMNETALDVIKRILKILGGGRS